VILQDTNQFVDRQCLARPHVAGLTPFCELARMSLC